MHLLFSSRKANATYLLVSILCGLLISLALIVFHSYNQSMSSSPLVTFDHTESTKCKAIAYGYFGLSFSFHCGNLLFFLNILLKIGCLKHIQMKGNKNEKYLMILSMTLAGVFMSFVFSPGNQQSPFCILQFTRKKQISISCVKGLLSLFVIGSIFTFQRQIEQTRKNSGRSEKKSEKILKVRMFAYALSTAMSALLDLILQNYFFSSIEADYLFILCAEFSLLPMSFPILFGLSTTQFKANVLSWIKRL